MNGSYSNFDDIFKGVPQGPILGLISCNIYIYDLFFGIRDLDTNIDIRDLDISADIPESLSGDRASISNPMAVSNIFNNSFSSIANKRKLDISFS